MAKRSQRRPVRYEKDQAGCIWGLISIFDFRHGRSTRRLLSDRRHPNRQVIGAGYNSPKLLLLTNSNEKAQKINDGGERDAMIADATKASVKELMEVEMFSEQDQKKQLNGGDMDAQESDSEHKCHTGRAKRHRKRTSRTSKSFCDIQFETSADENLGPDNSYHQGTEEKTLIVEVVKSAKNLDMDLGSELRQKIQQHSNCIEHECSYNLDVQSGRTHSVFDKKLSEAIKVFVDQRFTDGKYPAEDGKINHSKEFMDALQTLSSNKELIVELLKDPNSLLVRYIQDLEGAQLEKDLNSSSLERSNLTGKLNDSKPAVPVVRKQHNFFRRRGKSQEKLLLKEDENCQTSNRIVILKPGPSGMQNSEIKTKLRSSFHSQHNLDSEVQNERNGSQFSFTELKRKLKNAIGKERHGVSSDDIAKRFPFERQNSGSIDRGIGGEKAGWSSPNRDHFYNERFARPAISTKNKDKSFKPKDTEASLGNGSTEYPEQRVSNIYVEARKHLSEMLSKGDEIEDFSSRQLPKSLGRILSLPEFNFSPICSPVRDKEYVFVTAQQKMSPYNNFHLVNNDVLQITKHVNELEPSRENLNSQPVIVDSLEDKVQSCNSNFDVPDECNHANAVERTLCSPKRDLSSAGDTANVQVTDELTQGDSKVLDIPSEQCSCSDTGDDRNSDLPELCGENESEQCMQVDSSQPDQLLSSPVASLLSSPISKNVGDLKSVNERLERPSPVSVLEPLFTEDDISPASIKLQPEPPIQPLQIHFEEQIPPSISQEICISTCIDEEESAFEYVEAVLLASDLKWEEFLLRWISSDQVLEPSLFGEVELFSNRSSHDQKLLFDCTNGVLTEVCDRYFGFSPWLSFVKHNIRSVPRGKDLIQEIWEGVEWQLLRQPSPCTLDLILRKDMEKDGTWMNLRYDVESIGADIGRAVFEELVEDTLLSFLNEGSATDSSVPQAQSLEIE